MSTHKVEIIEIGEVLTHSNADRLEKIHILGWQCCVGKGDFKTGDKAIYIEPDYLCDLSHPSFAFLKKEGETKQKERIKVRKFKGQISQGLIIPVPSDLAELPVGTNVIEQLGIERYEPPMPMSTGGTFCPGPAGLYH